MDKDGQTVIMFTFQQLTISAASYYAALMWVSPDLPEAGGYV